MNLLALRRLLRGTRGTAPLHAILVLAAALFILMGLRSLLFNSRIDATAIVGNGKLVLKDGGTPRTTTARPALGPEAAKAQSRLDELPDLAMAKDVADLAYHDEGSAGHKAFLERYGRDWNVRFFDNPWTGAKMVVVNAKDSTAPRVFLGVGGTEGTDPRHWAVNLGQHLPAEAAAEAVAEVGVGVARRSIAGIVLAPVRFALSTVGRADYDGIAAVTGALRARYGAENVILAGHSKGGGEVTFASAMNGVRAYTFNAAGMSRASLDIIRRGGVPNPERFITNVVAEGELLNRVDVLGTKLGEVITVEGGGTSSLDNHGLRNVLIDRPVRYQPARPFPR